jgi:hypothetical protein
MKEELEEGHKALQKKS